MYSARSAKRRRRKPPPAYTVDSMTAAEQKFLFQAIANSKLDKHRTPLQVPSAPVFYPTVEDMKGNPMDYFQKIRPIAEPYGICKIVPPEGWNPAPFCIDPDNTQRFQTKQQMIHRLQEGISFGDGTEYSAMEYTQMASQHCKKYQMEHYPHHDLLKEHVKSATDKLYTVENLERDYWERVETHKPFVVEYGNDVDSVAFGSGFPLSERGRSVAGGTDTKSHLPEPEFGTEDFYKETYWNLNNLPRAPNSVLRHVKVGINGINVPWMYYGSLFSTFCWHNEDNYLASINYHHRGAPKVWYGVPGEKHAAEGLEKVFKSYLSMKMRDVPDLLHHITTMFSPRLLQNAQVPVYKLLQYPGEFVVTFPRSFHGGFSLGPNAGEAVNFATHDWISYGSEANERYRSFARTAVFSHDRLTFTMANHLDELRSYYTCKRLLDELERVVNEELSRRRELLREGVRDVSNMITLPPNRLDQLDDRSADYDDRRLCHACKHVCFFSAVACECSQSKVSCLRHSYDMCRCASDRRYFMIWSTDEELISTLDRVREHCNTLKTNEGAIDEGIRYEEVVIPAPGSVKDAERHRDDVLTTDPIFCVPVSTSSSPKPPSLVKEE